MYIVVLGVCMLAALAAVYQADLVSAVPQGAAHPGGYGSTVTAVIGIRG